MARLAEKEIAKEKFHTTKNPINIWDVNPIQDGLFAAPLPKICHRYSSMMKLGTVIPYLKKIQKIYESCDTPLEFC